ncbi:MAG: hypothetical protein MJ147_02055 [Clostridia bacterium]|nr:hypothetical protein [Clostridia bacterium]
MIVKKITSILFACLLAFSCFSLSASAKTLYISELTIAVGEEAAATLEKNGYNILFQRMNLITDDEAPTYLAYKKGGTAVTDIIVSGSKAQTISYKSVTYNLVSGTSLNNGTDGAPLYLYYTKDTKAGDGISSLETVSGFSNKDEIIPLLNDGSSPVRTTDGKLANLDKGIENCQLYLIKKSAESVKPYVSDIHIVSGKSKSEAVIAAANSGCDYYLDYDMNKLDGYTFVAYQRTSDKADAVTSFTVKGSDVNIEKKEGSSSALLGISESRLFEGNFTLGIWTEMFMHTSASVSRNAPAYTTLLSSKEECTCVPVESAKQLFAIYLGKLVASEPATEAEETSVVTEEAESTEEADDTYKADNADATDEIFDIEKEEETTTVAETEDENAEMSIASVFGSGKVLSIVIIAVAAIALLIGLKFIVERKKRNEKNS